MSLWNVEDVNCFNNSLQNNVGQINLDTKFGKRIYDFSKNPKVKSILEIGTWNGLGSTRCFVESLKTRNDYYIFYSLECNSDKYQIAKDHYKDLKNINILNEVLLQEMPKDIYDRFPELKINQQFNYWNSIDFQNMKDKNLFLKRVNLPEIFDIIMLDGGEFTTYYEFQILKNRCKIFMMDDVNVSKGRLIYEEIINNPNMWEVIEKDNERNGFLICKNKLNYDLD